MLIAVELQTELQNEKMEKGENIDYVIWKGLAGGRGVVTGHLQDI